MCKGNMSESAKWAQKSLSSSEEIHGFVRLMALNYAALTLYMTGNYEIFLRKRQSSV